MSGAPARRDQDSLSFPSESSLEEIHLAVHRGRYAAEYWRSLTISRRMKFLRSFRRQLIRELDSLVSVVQSETAKPRFDLVGEIFHAANLCRYLERQSPKWLKSQSRPTGFFVHQRASVVQEPLGLVAAITPCNYPIVLFLSPALQALAAGNAIIVKPSEWTSATSTYLQGIFDEVGIPEDVIQVIQGGPLTGKLLAGSGVDKVFFTGGREGGRAVYQAAAELLTPVVLELGGNDAMIVCEDADIERAAHAAVWGAFFNAGQSCIAVERVYVHRDQADDFTRRIVELTHRVTTGWKHSSDQHDFDTGPIATEAQFLRLLQLIEDSKRRGARVLVGGKVIDRGKRCLAPTVLARVDHTMRIMKEETFGPILPIQSFEDDDEAIDLANDSDLGLAASVWSRSRRRAKRIADRLDVGGVVINDTMVHFGIPSLPFGGHRGSGFGRIQGREGFNEFVQTKSVVTHRFGPRLEWQWFPNGTKHRPLALACRWLLGR
jgi:acyl-CoA reductase-like NAD-dependent aldehyde dehydrogenase